MYSTSYAAAAAATTHSHPSQITQTPLPQPSPPPAKTVWPQPVRDYVSRAFMADNAIPGISKEEIGAKLKQVITDAAESNLLALIDWPTHLLPQQIIQRDRYMQQRASSHAAQVGLKRKSPEPTHSGQTTANHSTTPPWRQNKQTLADRMSKNDKRQKTTPAIQTAAATAAAYSSKSSDLEKRRQRFEAESAAAAAAAAASNIISPASAYPSNDPLYTSSDRDGPIVGTCQKIEKNYLRLTAPPVPESVRPPSVLKQTFDFLITKWKEEHDYGYICDQFKSLRQDLTVQHVKNAFTVRVYEAHARIALEKGDLGEYNQCQTQLRSLYKQNIPGCSGEFLAYRILYFIHTRNRSNLGDLLANMTTTDKQNSAVHHALQVRKALATSNYHKFFRLYNDVPNMGGYLVDRFVDRERLVALSCICRAYKPDVRVHFITIELSFDNDQECAQFLSDYGGEHLLEPRDDGDVRFVTGKAGQIFDVARQTHFGRVDIKGQI